MTTLPPSQSGIGTVSPTSSMPSLLLGTASPITSSPLDEDDDTEWPTMSPEKDTASSTADVSDKGQGICLLFSFSPSYIISF